MSVMTLKKMARKNVKDADELLEEWRQAINRGDVTQEQARSVVDALLEFRTASVLKCAPSGKGRKVAA